MRASSFLCTGKLPATTQPCAAGSTTQPPEGSGTCSAKGLALDLLFLKAQARFILHQPMRIPVVDAAANSALVRHIVVQV